MKHFMLPRNAILREAVHNEPATQVQSPNHPRSKPTPSPSSRRTKSSKENAPPPDLNSMSSDQKPSPSPASKLKSPLPPRPPSSNPLKRKLSMETVQENSASDSGVKVIVRMRPLKKDEEEGEIIVQKMTDNSLAINGQTLTFDSVVDMEATQALFLAEFFSLVS